MNTGLVYLLVTVAVFFGGANFTLAGPVMTALPPLWAAAARFLFGTLLIMAIVAWRGGDLIGAARRHAPIYLMLGVVGIGGFNLLFFFALQHTSPANAALILATNPLLTTLLAAATLGERPTARQIAALPLALVGVVVVISGGSLARLAALKISSGDALMIAADFAWAAYNVLTRRFMPAGPPLTNTSLVMAAGAILLMLVALGSGEPLAMPGGEALAALAIMVVGGTVLFYLFWSIGIAHLGAGRTSLFLNLVPVFAMLLDTLAGILPTAAQLVGGALVIGGVTLAMLPRRQPAPA